jgi:isoaspartyl peptidase/L-asparaginase-like protein (Ntn-hydrolase superfamily)
VGFGGSPDEHGDVRLDAMLMDGVTMQVGAVGSMRRVKNAIGVARAVHERTKHTLLVGEDATRFAVEMGFPTEPLETAHSDELHASWLAAHCQPNFRRNVLPNATESCGPYKPAAAAAGPPAPSDKRRDEFSRANHDTIAMLAVNRNGSACGTSTNGARNKIAGRVGDSPIPGSGCFATRHGACGMTGDGDISMRFAPCAIAMHLMATGATPTAAATHALRQIAAYFPAFQGALVLVDGATGAYGAANHGFLPSFQYSVRTAGMSKAQLVTVKPLMSTV